MNGELLFPTRLEEWTLEVIRMLVIRKVREQSTFDFKLSLPHGSADIEKLKVRKALCSFANSDGGFLVYGVHDDITREGGERLVGIAETDDFPQQFSNYAVACRPSVQYIPSLPIALLPGRVLYVVHVPKSRNAPHGVVRDGALEFVKRVPGGTAPMSLEEIRNAMIDRYEKLSKIVLLRGEIAAVVAESSFQSGRQSLQEDAYYSAPYYDLSVVKSILAEVYTILEDQKDIVYFIQELRKKCFTVDGYVEQISRYDLQTRNHSSLIDRHNRRVERISIEIERLGKDCLRRLDDFLSSETINN